MDRKFTIAITGATGFVGRAVLDCALARNFAVRALTRKSGQDRKGVTWIRGDLSDQSALDELCVGADAVLHIAGEVNGVDREHFASSNIEGTYAIAKAAEKARIQRFVYISSLAARHPEISNYGWSKSEAERILKESDLNWIIVRPPAIYGPGDKDIRKVFQLAEFGIKLNASWGKTSIIYVDDLASLLLEMCATRETKLIFEPDDGRPNGYTYSEILESIFLSVGNKRLLSLKIAKRHLKFFSVLERLLSGQAASLKPDRISYLSHDDWVVSEEFAKFDGVWQATTSLEEGVMRTAASIRLSL